MSDNGRFAGGKDARVDRVSNSEQIRWSTLLKLFIMLDLLSNPHHMHGGGCVKC